MEQYSVTGMSCAACSARVEKAVAKVPGVTSCSVSLLTNSMGVEGGASASDIIAAVEEAGYEAAPKVSGDKSGASTKAPAENDLLKDRETPILKKRLFFGSVDVCIDGTYDVELACSGSSGWKSCGNGTDSAVVYHGNHGSEPEVFHQRL